jgi:hypothetical protein
MTNRTDKFPPRFVSYARKPADEKKKISGALNLLGLKRCQDRM